LSFLDEDLDLDWRRRFLVEKPVIHSQFLVED